MRGPVALRTEFGWFDHQVSGYSLERLLPEDGRNLTPALVGAGGTCGIFPTSVPRLLTRLDQTHLRLTHRSSWAVHDKPLSIMVVTVIRLALEYLPRQREAEPVWRRSSMNGGDVEEVARGWQAYLRRFDLKLNFRFWKPTLDWTAPKICSS